MDDLCWLLRVFKRLISPSLIGGSSPSHLFITLSFLSFHGLCAHLCCSAALVFSPCAPGFVGVFISSLSHTLFMSTEAAYRSVFTVLERILCRLKEKKDLYLNSERFWFCFVFEIKETLVVKCVKVASPQPASDGCCRRSEPSD